MSAREVRELRLYDQRFPIDDQSNFQLPAAMIQALYANAHRDRGDEPHKVTDFMPFYPEPDPDEPVDLDAKFRAVLSRMPKKEEGDAG